ncbi:MAG TPA: MmcQ/YjbR family DNA-binding protein [Bryobacteraceae bacterium]|nr:MmcQ/YjbR family DNA-binding protein [Bryobacteraceae bacterium]
MAMLDWLRRVCLSFPETTEGVQWTDALVFKVAGKIFAIAALEPGNKYFLTLKCPPEKFAEMVERPGIAPAPYLARAKWIALEEEDAVTRSELKEMIAESYRSVVAKLPKKQREVIAASLG